MKKTFSIFLLIVTCMSLMTGCEPEEAPVPGGDGGAVESVSELPLRMAETDYNQGNTYYMLNDDEPQEVYFDQSQRSFYVNNPLQCSMDDNQNLRLRFYSPRALKNVTVWASIEGHGEDFKLITLERLHPFQELTVHFPFGTEDVTAYTRSGKKITIVANPYLTGDNLTFTVESDDPYWATLQSITCGWRIAFAPYSGGYWTYKMKSTHCREAVAIALNMSYMFSSPKFESALHEFGPLHSDDALTEIDKAGLLRGAIGHYGLIFGYVTGANGLGGGTTYGLHEHCYLEHYADDLNDTSTMFHEFAHCLGYGHNGNMTYENTGPGWITLCANVHRELSLNKELPVYSRRFLHSRWSRNRYFDDVHVASRYIIEDPELDAIDGGISPLRPDGSDEGGNDGEPLSFRLGFEDVPGATSESFTPKDVYAYGDDLYVVNDAEGNYSLEVFSMASGSARHVRSIREWAEGDTVLTFKGPVNGVVRANGKIYVTHKGSRTEIFDAETFGFITCIGTGSWGTGVSQTVHAFDIVLHNGLVFIRDKRYVCLVEERSVVAGKLPTIYARTENLGESDGTYSMAVNDENGLLYSVHPSRRIDFFDPSLIREATFGRAGNFAYESVPYGIGFFGGRMFVSSNGSRKFCEADPATGAVLNDFTVIGDVTLESPEKFCIRRNTLFIVDRTANGPCIYAIPMSELK